MFYHNNKNEVELGSGINNIYCSDSMMFRCHNYLNVIKFLRKLSENTIYLI